MRSVFVQFAVIATDDGIPPRSAQVSVAINITHDKFAPQFINSPYTVPMLPETKDVGSVVLQVSGFDQDQRVSILLILK